MPYLGLPSLDFSYRRRCVVACPTFAWLVLGRWPQWLDATCRFTARSVTESFFGVARDQEVDNLHFVGVMCGRAQMLSTPLAWWDAVLAWQWPSKRWQGTHFVIGHYLCHQFWEWEVIINRLCNCVLFYYALFPLCFWSHCHYIAAKAPNSWSCPPAWKRCQKSVLVLIGYRTNKISFHMAPMCPASCWILCCNRTR